MTIFPVGNNKEPLVYQSRIRDPNTLNYNIDFIIPAVYNYENLEKALSIMEETINKNLEKLDGHISLVHMFEFNFTNKENWTLDVLMNNTEPYVGEHYYCFNSGYHKEALELVQSYIAVEFEGKIQEIKIEDNLIHINWKS